MTFLPIVSRELRLSSRRRGTYWLRCLLALAALVIWFFLLVVSRSSMPPARRAEMLFGVMSMLSFAFCLLAGVFLTADSVSEEKREGTIGLLFLTDLKGYDVVLGKLIATSLHAFYGFFAILPLLGLPLLMGGVTEGQFWRVGLALLTTLLVSLSIGILISTLCREARQAMATTLFLLLLLGGGLHCIVWLQAWLFKSSGSLFLLWASPANLLSQAFDQNFALFRFGRPEFWYTFFTLAILGLGSLAVASFYLPHAWREKASGARSGEAAGWRWRWRFGGFERRACRRPLLVENPFHWLATRDRLQAAGVWIAVVPLFCAWLSLFAGSFAMTRGIWQMWFSLSLLAAFGLHQALKIATAFEACRRLSEDRLSGALELLLVTPLTVGQILTGQSRALWRIFSAPMLLVFSANVALFWRIMFFKRQDLPPEAIATFSAALLGGGLLLLLDFRALGWVGMSLAVQGKRYHRALLGTLARVMLGPWLAIFFTFLLGSSGALRFSNWDPLVFVIIWLSFAVVCDVIFAERARTKLELEFRTICAQTNDPAPSIFLRSPPALAH